MDSLMKYINVTSRCSTEFRTDRLKGRDLNGTQCVYILHVCKYPGITQDKLAAHIYIDKSNVARQLAILERSGYVARKKCPEDNRAVMVYPTLKAEEVLPEMKAVFRDWNEYLVSDFTDEEKAVFFPLLKRITEKAQAYAEGRK